jgi:putative Mn2+ efflux pump MntP
MLWEGREKKIRPKQRRTQSDPTRGLRLLTLSVATSLDALAVGMSMAFLGVSVWLPSAVIGAVTAMLTTIGILFGVRIGSRWGCWADVVGGLVLILIGVKMLLGRLTG